MGNIVLLDDLTINQIAAGEVIERPASVIKEMVENSIDAGANNITVEIKNGGISYIKVTDNGKGIAQDDLEIAFERHATSKIRSADDLDTVTSMGFRGEALASIAAIATVELVSKTKEQDVGYKVVVEAGEILNKEETACPTGTSITVRNLFFNTPVRYKFLKKDYTESGYVEDVITRIALVNPNIAIKLINSGKTVIQTNGNGDMKSVIYSIYGKDIANGIMEVSYKYEDINITGVIGKPEIARSNRSNQLFFVNKRYIKDKALTAATEQAYKGLIPIGKFGFVVLNIDMNPAKVDVNVHPAKLEVRFEEESKIFQAIYHSIKDSLLKTELVANSEKSIHAEESNNTNEQKNNSYRELSFEERLKNLKESKKENQTGGLFSFRKQNQKQIEEYTEEESKIKTNVVEDNLKNNSKVGEPINTSDILEQLKKLKENMEKEIQNKESSKEEQNQKLKEESTEYTINKDEKADGILNKTGEYLEGEGSKERKAERTKESVDENVKIETEINLDTANQAESTDSEQTVENKEEQIKEMDLKTEEIIEKIENPEIKQEFKEIKEKISEIGKISIISSNYSQYSSRYNAFKRGEILPAFDVNKSGGALMDLNVYNIHFVVGLFGAPNKVEYFANIEKGIDTSGVAILEYPTFKAICIGAKDCGAPIISTIQGDQGCVKIDGPTSVLTDVQILRNGRDSEILPTGNYHRMYSEFKVFAECIDNNDFTTCNKMLEHSRIVMDVLTKARQSANIIFGCERDTK